MRLLLDTTVLIDALRGRRVVDRLRAHNASGDELCTTPINVEEIARGLLDPERETVKRLLTGLLVLPLGRSEGLRAGLWRRDYATRGVTLSQADCLIAAAALSADARLATANVKDFPMPEITVEEWSAGG